MADRDPIADRSPVSDRLAITDLIYRYGRAVDRCDHELGYSIWHDDSYADYGAQTYQGSGRGFIDFVCLSHSHLINHQHLIGQVIIDLAGDEAGSEAYFHANILIPGENGAQNGNKHLGVWGRYLDRWAYRDGRWGIVRRQALIDFDDLRESRPFSTSTGGARDRSDPSYAILPGYFQEPNP